MRIKTTLTTLSAIIVLTMTAHSAYSQNNAFSALRSMGPALNTSATDAAPTLAPNGLSLYLTSDRPGTLGATDIWVSQRATLGSAWGAPQNVGVLNSAGTDSVNAISLDGRTMFFQSSRTGGIGARDLYLSTRTNPNNDFGWTTPVNLGAVVNTTFDELGAAYFEDPATGAGTLIFSSSRSADPPFDYHLYQSTRNPDGSFNPPALLSDLSAIGTGVEIRAAIRRDGLEIFIASARPGGLVDGVFDIWYSTRASTSSPWSTPALVPGVNTLQDDSAPSLSPDGSILFFQSARPGGVGLPDLYSATRCSIYGAITPCNVNRPPADFDGDGRTDIGVFRPSLGTWYILQTSNFTILTQQFGTNGDKVAAGDYDGDGRSDLAVFRPSDSTWYIKRSSDGTVSTTKWGLSTDKPVPADYDGDGKTDIAVFRDGVWYILQSSNGSNAYQWGSAGDIPIAAPAP
ncbi:MAG: FG-GAP-like repeat-containing protein [Pyrinomonadaceae bacterium]